MSSTLIFFSSLISEFFLLIDVLEDCMASLIHSPTGLSNQNIYSCKTVRSNLKTKEEVKSNLL